ncbi:MAG: ferredoxin [Pseudomonadota bacterium]
MKVRIIEEACIGCGACADICPAVFAMGERAAEVIVSELPPEAEDDARDAADGCPTEAIVVEE